MQRRHGIPSGARCTDAGRSHIIEVKVVWISDKLMGRDVEAQAQPREVFLWGGSSPVPGLANAMLLCDDPPDHNLNVLIEDPIVHQHSVAGWHQCTGGLQGYRMVLSVGVACDEQT